MYKILDTATDIEDAIEEAVEAIGFSAKYADGAILVSRTLSRGRWQQCGSIQIDDIDRTVTARVTRRSGAVHAALRGIDGLEVM